MATVIGPARRRRLETRQRPQMVEGFICRACSRGFDVVYVRPCRIWDQGLERPGVQCPRCLKAWVETLEDETGTIMEPAAGPVVPS